MTYKLLVAATLSLGLGTAVAMAQTETTQPEAGAASGATAESQLPSGWDGAIGDAFFADQEMGTLRSQEEVSTNWQALTEEQQAQVRSHCDTMDTAAATPAPAGDATQAPADGDTTAGAETQDNVTTGSTTPDAMHTASIEQVCDWVDAM